MRTFLALIGIGCTIAVLIPSTISGDVACTSIKITFGGTSVTGACVDAFTCMQGPYLITGYTGCGRGQSCCFSSASTKDCSKIKSSGGTAATCELMDPGCRGKTGSHLVAKAECPKKGNDPSPCCLAF